MRRKTLAILTLIGLGLFLVSIGTIVVETAVNAVYCSSPNCPLPSIPSTPPTWQIVVSIIGEVSILAAGVLQIIAWIGAMTKQAKRQQWTWFVCTFLFSPICLWIYLLAVPEALELVYIQPEQPIYRPYTQGYGAPKAATSRRSGALGHPQHSRLS
ncbi:hypothetical protein [Dictyobacter formicarum]|uniref:hypothetical protein n=1 Tax=Dictyobacter formicarum TaxID=2778368 RepID=UPI00191691A2|nr:hypothetical protein [Dictyobacter formicarum]